MLDFGKIGLEKRGFPCFNRKLRGFGRVVRPPQIRNCGARRHRKFISLMDSFGVQEITRTGKVALPRK